MTTLTLQQAYQHCQQIVRNHYENFPVASWFLPKKLRLPISVIYAFARHADDLADEGELNDSERYKALEHYQADFEKALKDSYSDNPLFFALTDVIKNHQLPTNLFFDLLTAFKMDTKTKRYANFDDVLNYCHYSANPVGRKTPMLSVLLYNLLIFIRTYIRIYKRTTVFISRLMNLHNSI